MRRVSVVPYFSDVCFGGTKGLVRREVHGRPGSDIDFQHLGQRSGKVQNETDFCTMQRRRKNAKKGKKALVAMLQWSQNAQSNIMPRGWMQAELTFDVRMLSATGGMHERR
jgi:hypothetical protein